MLTTAREGEKSMLVAERLNGIFPERRTRSRFTVYKQRRPRMRDTIIIIEAAGLMGYTMMPADNIRSDIRRDTVSANGENHC